MQSLLELIVHYTKMQPQLENKEKKTLAIIVVTIIRIGFTSAAINELYSSSMYQNILRYLRHIARQLYCTQAELAKHIEILYISFSNRLQKIII